MQADREHAEGKAPRPPQLLRNENQASLLERIQGDPVAHEPKAPTEQRLEGRLVERVVRRHPDVRVDLLPTQDVLAAADLFELLRVRAPGELGRGTSTGHAQVLVPMLRELYRALVTQGPERLPKGRVVRRATQRGVAIVGHDAEQRHDAASSEQVDERPEAGSVHPRGHVVDAPDVPRAHGYPRVLRPRYARATLPTSVRGR